MTCVVGIIDHTKKEVYICADTACSEGPILENRKDLKIFKVGRFIIGFTGSYRFGQLLKYNSDIEGLWLSFIPYTDDKEMEFLVKSYIPYIRSICRQHGVMGVDEDQSDIGYPFLIGFNSRLFLIDDDFQVAEHSESYQAIGSGKEVALGSLYTSAFMPNLNSLDRAILAVNSAIKFVQSCGGQVSYITTKEE